MNVKEALKNYQEVLFPYAYNILGSAEDARDAIQDVLYNYVSLGKEDIENEKGYLIRSVINQSINIRNKRKKFSYGDMWLPEPVATEQADTNIHLRDIVSYSMMILLEQLNAKERAVFILKESFGYSHEEIAEVLSTSVENSRKLLSRAKGKVNPTKQPARMSNREAGVLNIVGQYIDAIRGRDMQQLEKLLAADIHFHADGGATINVVSKMGRGFREVVDVLLTVYEKYEAHLQVSPGQFNYQPALLYHNGSRVHVCQVFNIDADGKIIEINNVVDPEKTKNIVIP